ncbi:oligopeptide ABC transporter substrate-binding protein [Lacticigenium naphthae]|uniref:oligopeptide ABC transporter substrate-binding protein n=1 Tax=Lacticigenium naphthae TaxID=515351 RepID=UPI000401B715|nr:oligopeptide ABC transporter substrate-binding protein [Lacticigenium naphthae]
MLKKKYSLLTSTAAIAFVLAACGGSGDTTDTTDSSGSGDTSDTSNGEVAEGVVDFESAVVNDGEVIDGGTLNVALVTDTPFQGLFSYELYEDAYDADLFQFTIEEIFGADENFQIDDSGAATLDLDQENNMATITLKDGVTWSDGEAVTTEDLLYSYEVIGHPDYTGIRYDPTMTNIVGMEEYHNGDADTISGITLVDDQTMEIQYQEVGVQMLQSGGGIWSGAMPKHQLEDIAIADLESSPEVRENPVGFGPFYVENIVAGESVEYVANPHYYKGEPQLDKVVVQVVPSSSIVAALENSQYDLALSMPTDLYETYSDLPGYTILGREQLAYTYIGFKLGEWDAEAGEVVPDENAKMADLALRQAMGYAMDNDAVGAQFYDGLRSRANSAIIPAFGGYHNPDVAGYPYDPEMAEQLLDEAGYEDVDGDGFREDPDGKPLEIKFASMAGGETAEPIAEYYMQSWAQVGLNVTLTDGRLLEFNSFYDRVEADDPEIDIYQGAWGTGTDPTPEGLYGRTAPFNYTRWASEENDQFLADMTSDKSFDIDWREGVFHEWQEYFSEQAPIIPTLFRNETLPVNNRVSEYQWGYDAPSDFGWHTVGVTSDDAATE